MRVAIIAQALRDGQAVGDNHQRHRKVEQLVQARVVLGLFQFLQIGDFGNAQHLHLVVVDKIQMPHQRQHGAVGFHGDAVVAACRACRPRQLQFVLVVLIELAHGDAGHGGSFLGFQAAFGVGA